MSCEEDARQIAELEETNARLKESLTRCRQLVSECHSKLAADTDTEAKPTFLLKSRERR